MGLDVLTPAGVFEDLLNLAMGRQCPRNSCSTQVITSMTSTSEVVVVAIETNGALNQHGHQRRRRGTLRFLHGLLKNKLDNFA